MALKGLVHPRAAGCSENGIVLGFEVLGLYLEGCTGSVPLKAFCEHYGEGNVAHVHSPLRRCKYCSTGKGGSAENPRAIRGEPIEI